MDAIYFGVKLCGRHGRFFRRPAVWPATYDACYTELRNNYIDIILDGSIAAARRITTVQIPSTGRYEPLYNPGGPGNDPAPGVLYSAPSPPTSEPVIDALNNPMTVTYVRCPHHSVSLCGQ